MAGPGAACAQVLIASINRSQGVTGVHTHTRALQDGLGKAGVACRTVSAFSGAGAWLPVFAMRRPLRLLSRDWGLRWYRHWHLAALRYNLRASLRDGRTTTVIAQCPLSALAALDARRDAGMEFRIVMVCHFNQSEAVEYREQGELRGQALFDEIDRLERDVMCRVDDVVYVSAWSRDEVERMRGILPRRSHVIWNGIADQVATTGLARADLGLAPDDVVLISVGTLEPRKNQLGLFDVFARLAPRHPHAKLLLVGDGPDRGALQKRISAAGLADRVRLLGHRTDVPALLALADIYVHFAHVESCPVALLEAARAGLPFAAVYGGGIAELAGTLESGVQLDPADPVACERIIDPLIRDANLRSELRQRSRRNFERSLTQDAMVTRYVQVLKGVS